MAAYSSVRNPRQLHKDRFYSSGALEQLRAQKPFELALIEGADHSMDVSDDLKASIEAVKQVVEGLHDFLTA